MGRPLLPLSIRAEDQAQLQAWTKRPKTAQALAMRSRVILLAAEGWSNTSIAQQLSVTLQTVGKWRQRYLDQGVDGLLDEPRPGTSRKLADKDVERVLALTLETTPADATHWSTRSLASKTGLSRASIHRIWRAFSLAPHRSETFKLSKDPLFIEKVRDIVGLYLAPPDRALVLCVDEKSQIQALDRTAPLLPMRPVILDNYGTHKTALIRSWLAKRPRYHLHFTPTSASWLNLVERWFAALTEKQLRRGVHRSTKELKHAISSFINNHNQDPKPFVWHKTADQILDSIARFCKRTLETGH